MGGQCSSEVAAHRQSADDPEHIDTQPAGDSPQSPVSGRICCGGIGRSVSSEGCQLVEAYPVAPEAGGEVRAAAAKSEQQRIALSQSFVGIGDPVAEDEDLGRCFFEEDDPLRWAPACLEAEDHMDPRRCMAMMAAMNDLIAPCAGDGYDSSANTTTASNSASRRAIGEELQREAAFASLREGRPLYSLPESFRADKEMVLAAIGAEGQYCYDYIASKELRERDRDVVAALLAEDGSILERCCEEFRSDRQLVRMALKTCSEVIRWIPKHLQTDKELKAIAAARAKEEQSLLKQLEEAVCAPVATVSKPQWFWFGR